MYEQGGAGKLEHSSCASAYRLSHLAPLAHSHNKMIPFRGGQEEPAIERPVFLVTMFHVKQVISALQKQCCTSIVGSSLATGSAATILSQNRDDIVSAKEQCCDRFVR